MKTAVINGYKVTYKITKDQGGNIINDPPTVPDPLSDAIMTGGVQVLWKAAAGIATGIGPSILGPTVQINIRQGTYHTAASSYFRNAYQNPANWKEVPENLAKVLGYRFVQ